MTIMKTVPPAERPLQQSKGEASMLGNHGAKVSDEAGTPRDTPAR